MPTRFATSAALLLALLGQLAGVFGMPLFRSRTTAEKPDSECGCCPADRNAHHCCCSKPTTDSTAGDAVGGVPSCCAKKHASISWSNPVLRQKCHGPNDSSAGSPTFAGISPTGPACWRFDAVDAGHVIADSYRLSSIPSLPESPPPRA